MLVCLAGDCGVIARSRFSLERIEGRQNLIVSLRKQSATFISTHRVEIIRKFTSPTPSIPLPCPPNHRTSTVSQIPTNPTHPIIIIFPFRITSPTYPTSTSGPRDTVTPLDLFFAVLTTWEKAVPVACDDEACRAEPGAEARAVPAEDLKLRSVEFFGTTSGGDHDLGAG